MPPLSLIFLILPIAMFMLLLVIAALRTVIHFPGWTFNIVAGFLILLPPLLIFHALGADVSGRIFPNRALAVLLLAAAALVNSIILAASIGIASLLIRLLNTT